MLTTLKGSVHGSHGYGATSLTPAAAHTASHSQHSHSVLSASAALGLSSGSSHPGSGRVAGNPHTSALLTHNSSNSNSNNSSGSGGGISSGSGSSSSISTSSSVKAGTGVAWGSSGSGHLRQMRVAPGPRGVVADHTGRDRKASCRERV